MNQKEQQQHKKWTGKTRNWSIGIFPKFIVILNYTGSGAEAYYNHWPVCLSFSAIVSVVVNIMSEAQSQRLSLYTSRAFVDMPLFSMLNKSGGQTLVSNWWCYWILGCFILPAITSTAAAGGVNRKYDYLGFRSGFGGKWNGTKDGFRFRWIEIYKRHIYPWTDINHHDENHGLLSIVMLIISSWHR